MPSLLDRATTIAGYVADIDQLKVRREDFEKLLSRSKQLQERVNDLNNNFSSFALMESHGILPAGPPPASKELRTRSIKLREQVLSDDWPAAIGNEQIATTFLSPIEAYNRKVAEWLFNSWREYVDSKVPKISDGLLVTLGNVFAKQVSRLQELKQRLERVRAGLPSDEKAFSELDTIAFEMTAIWRELEGVPEKVREFLMRAVQRQAKVAELTPEVKAWLESHEMLMQLRIGFA